MKKNFFIFAVTLFATIHVMAQQEVHGVETRMVCTYDCNPNGTWESWGDDKYPWFGFEFTNLNSIPVSVEVELYRNGEFVKKENPIMVGYVDYVFENREILVATKHFVLKSNESYVFKTNEHGISVYYEPNVWYGHSNYYVKYKAYKLL